MLGQDLLHAIRRVADAKEHDALVPYEQLSRHDRRHIRSQIEYEELEHLLANAVEYSRGPARDFAVEEMRPGLPVAFIVAGSPWRGARSYRELDIRW